LSLPYIIEPMTLLDIDEVLEIERASFVSPWSSWAFRAELALPYTVYRVVRLAAEGRRPEPGRGRPRWRQWGGRREQGRGPIVGYGGLQVILEDGHVMTLAVRPDHRGRGISELLLLDLFERARQRGVLRLTLEVRVSNVAAQSLYSKYGFTVQGRRSRYYANGEDALIMWTGRLDSAQSLARLDELRRRLLQRMAALETKGDADSGFGNVL